MPDSDDEYVQDVSDDDIGAHQVTRGKSRRRGAAQTGGEGGFQVNKTWEDIVEGEDGTLAVDGLLDAGKRKRLLRDTTPLQRGIIRHLVLVLDLSEAMLEKDMRPSRYLLTIRYASDFVNEYFEQNPISQLAIVGMRDGIAERVSDMSGNPSDHVGKLDALRTKDAKGLPSLQNALIMARGALYHAPSHGTREVLILYGSLLSSDPGDIHTTIADLVTSHITATVIGLSAELAICRTLVARTNPAVRPDEAYSVALDEVHYRQLIMRATTPPATAASLSAAERAEDAASRSSLLMKGFPSRAAEREASFCACHSRPARGGYLCSRCDSKVCQLPAQCPCCGLTLILSTHLARSYHHLFPLRNWAEVPWEAAAAGGQPACFGCLAPFPAPPPRDKILDRRRKLREQQARGQVERGVSESGRYACEMCGRHFCIDCDVLSHEVVHNCPGCLSTMQPRAGRDAVHEDGAMDVDPK